MVTTLAPCPGGHYHHLSLDLTPVSKLVVLLPLLPAPIPSPETCQKDLPHYKSHHVTPPETLQ